MSTFGDFTPGDADDTAPPDPEAVARILWTLLRARLRHKFRAWDAHSAKDRAAIVDALAVLLARLRDEGAL